MTTTPVAVLTNGSLFWQAEVREELALADVVMPSLDAGNEVLFRAVNRPHPSITFENLVSGLIDFRREFSGQYWLEVLLLTGYTDSPAHVREIAELASRIEPDQVQLNTAVRPPAEEFAMPVPKQRLIELAPLFKPRAIVIAEYDRRPATKIADADEQAVMELLRRRPCTLQDIAQGLGIKPAVLVKLIDALQKRGSLQIEMHGAQTFYRASSSK